MTDPISNDPDAPRPSGPATHLPSFVDAWESLAEERAALTVKQLLVVNVDVQEAALTALGAHPAIALLRDEAIATWPGFDPRSIDELPRYAGAAYQSHAYFQIADVDVWHLPALYDEANELRATLFADLAPLRKRGLTKNMSFASYRGTRGYAVVAADLALLSTALRFCLDAAAGATSTTEAELDHAAALSMRIAVSAERRNGGPAATAAAALDRQRAFTLFARRYDELRRVVTYLRWHQGDADRIAPSLYRRRHKRRSKPRPPSHHDAHPPTESNPDVPSPSPTVDHETAPR